MFEISGTVIDDNVGAGQENIPIFVGNLEHSTSLRRFDTTGTNGVFRFVVSVQTWSEWTNSLPKGATVVPTFDRPRKSELENTNLKLMNEQRYLYMGRDGMPLYRYRIPYEEVNQTGEFKQSRD